MVSLEQRQALASLSEADPRLKMFALFISGQSISGGEMAGDIREELLASIALNNSPRFQNSAKKIGERRVSSDSDWCQDDYLLFLLMLGNEKFELRLPFLKSIIEVRRRNSNRIPRQINDVFSALERREFRIEGDLCFLKIPFLHLTGNLTLDSIGAQNALENFSEPHLFENLSPFLKMLAQKAHDLILNERKPLQTESIPQLIEGFEVHSRNLSLRQSWKILTALPGRIILGAIVFFLGLGLIPILFGVGKSLYDSLKPNEIRQIPTSLKVAKIHKMGPGTPLEIAFLAKAILTIDTSQARPLVFELELEPFTISTPPFVVEVSHQEKPVRQAIAYIRPNSEDASFTIVPVQRDGGRFRTILPGQTKGGILCFLLKLDSNGSENLEEIKRRVILRSLQ